MWIWQYWMETKAIDQITENPIQMPDGVVQAISNGTITASLLIHVAKSGYYCKQTNRKWIKLTCIVANIQGGQDESVAL